MLVLFYLWASTDAAPRIAAIHGDTPAGYQFVRRGPCRLRNHQWVAFSTLSKWDDKPPLCAARKTGSLFAQRAFSNATTQECASACEAVGVCQAFDIGGCSKETCIGACFFYYKASNALDEQALKADPKHPSLTLSHCFVRTRFPATQLITSVGDARCAKFEKPRHWPDPKDFLATLRPFVHSVASNQRRTVVFTTVTFTETTPAWELYMLRSLLQQTSKVGLNVSVVGVDADGTTCDVLSRWRLPCVHSLDIYCSVSARQHATDRVLAVDAKYYIAYQLLKGGHSVVFTDIDITYYQNPLMFFEPQFDLQGLSDNQQAPGVPRNASEQTCEQKTYGGYCQSTGLWFAAPSRPVIDFFHHIMLRLRSECTWEQRLWNVALQESNLTASMRYHVLRRQRFANFGVVYKRMIKTSRPDEFDTLVALHMGWVHGADKVNAMLTGLVAPP